MGASQSYLNIFLMNKGKEYKEEGCTIKPSKAVVAGSIEFEVVTYTITYPGEGMNFDIYIYNTEETPSNPSYIFAYCSPRIPSHVANKIEVYYSVLAPKIPLVISFVRSADTYKCEIDKLRSAGWDWASSISAHSSDKDLVKLLKDQFKNLLWDRTMEFVVGGSTAKDVIGFEQKLGDKNYRFIFVTKNSMSVIGSECLFSLDSAKGEPSCSEGKNPVDPYFLDPVTKVKFFDGIIVYFAREQDKPDGKAVKDEVNGMVLLLQFVDVRKSTILIKRKDKDGFWWSKESVPFKDDASVLTLLKEIKENAEKNDVNTILLDNNDGYKGVTEVPSEDGGAFMKYTHKFNEAKKPVLLFERNNIVVGPFTKLETQVKHVEVYYLKAGGNNDKKPFLIVLDESGVESEKKKKGYHFNNKEEFKDWVEFTFKKGDTPLQGEELISKLYEKVGLIQKYGGCTPELHLLRELVYKILIAKDEEEIKKSVPPKESDRPPLHPEQPKPPEPLPLGWIITGSVGGTVFIIGSTVGYGIYWYNTTIRLLT